MLKLMAQLCLIAASPMFAQTFTLGTAADPCVGGTAFTVPSTGATVRYGDFTCTFPVADSGNVQVQLDFIEPCQATGDCGVLVTRKGQRVQNTFVQDSPATWNYDIFTAGLPASSRVVLAWPVNGTVIVRVQTVVRAGVLAGVRIGPMNVNLTATCVGSGPGWDCTGLGLIGKFVTSPATAQMLNLPKCTGTGTSTVPCWK